MTNVQSAEYKTPEFTLQVTITGVGADIRLNDISVEFETFSGHSTMTYDVNPSVISGVNQLKIIAFPFFSQVRGEGQTKGFHEEAEIKAALFVNEKGSDEKFMLTQIHFRPGLPLDQATNDTIPIDGLESVILDDKKQPLSFPNYQIEQQIIAIRTSLPVQDNYPKWAWQDGQVIEENQDNYDSLLAAYREIYKAYENKDHQQLLNLHAPRSTEYAVAYYLDGVEAGHEFMNTGKLANRSDLKLLGFHTNHSKLDVFADGKMARIIDIAQYHPVVFRNKENGLFHKLKFGFYKNQQGEWVLIR